MVGPKNPDEQCANYGHYWGFAEEQCSKCGFDPCDNEEDAAFNDSALLTWKSWKAGDGACI